jgi:hypothetical protein
VPGRVHWIDQYARQSGYFGRIWAFNVGTDQMKIGDEIFLVISGQIAIRWGLVGTGGSSGRLGTIMSAGVLHAGLGRTAGRNLTNTAWSIVEEKCATSRSPFLAWVYERR